MYLYMIPNTMYNIYYSANALKNLLKLHFFVKNSAILYTFTTCKKDFSIDNNNYLQKQNITSY